MTESREAIARTPRLTLKVSSKTAGKMASNVIAYAQQLEAERNRLMEQIKSLSNGWISVNERLPEKFTTVLIWHTDIPHFVGPITAFWTGEKWCADVARDNFKCSHWMLLPMTPTES